MKREREREFKKLRIKELTKHRRIYEYTLGRLKSTKATPKCTLIKFPKDNEERENFMASRYIQKEGMSIQQFS